MANQDYNQFRNLYEKLTDSHQTSNLKSTVQPNKTVSRDDVGSFKSIANKLSHLLGTSIYVLDEKRQANNDASTTIRAIANIHAKSKNLDTVKSALASLLKTSGVHVKHLDISNEQYDIEAVGMKLGYLPTDIEEYQEHMKNLVSIVIAYDHQMEQIEEQQTPAYSHRVHFTRRFTSGKLKGLTHESHMDFVSLDQAKKWIQQIKKKSDANSLNYMLVDYSIEDLSQIDKDCKPKSPVNDFSQMDLDAGDTFDWRGTQAKVINNHTDDIQRPRWDISFQHPSKGFTNAGTLIDHQGKSISGSHKIRVNENNNLSIIKQALNANILTRQIAFVDPNLRKTMFSKEIEQPDGVQIEMVFEIVAQPSNRMNLIKQEIITEVERLVASANRRAGIQIQSKVTVAQTAQEFESQLRASHLNQPQVRAYQAFVEEPYQLMMVTVLLS
jgi:hypothetical protein